MATATLEFETDTETSTDNLVTIDTADLQQEIADSWDQNFERVRFETHTFGGMRKVEGIEATYKGQKLNDDTVAGLSAKLIPKELSAPVELARSRIYQLLRNRMYCHPADADGHYYVSTKHSETFIAAFNNQVAAFNKAADDIAAAYPEIMAYLRDHWIPVLIKAKQATDITEAATDAVTNQITITNETIEPLVYDPVDFEAEFMSQIGRHLPADAKALRACYHVTYAVVDTKGTGKRFAAGPVAEFFQNAYANYHTKQVEHRRERYKGVIANIRDQVAMLGSKLRDTKIRPAAVESLLGELAGFEMVAEIVDPPLVEAVRAIRERLSQSHAHALNSYANGGKYSKTISASEAMLARLSSRVLHECDAATSEAALADRFQPRKRAVRLLSASFD